MLARYSMVRGAPSSALPRVTIDSAQPLGVNVEAALAFIAA